MAPGRPRKKARNTSGLRNQQLDRLSPLPGSPLASIESDGTAPRSTPSWSRSRAPSLWGWCKYRYHETIKKTFQVVKDTVQKYLDACPTEVIRRFINRSWRFMSAYWCGLTGRAAAWAVRKQKQHRQVSQQAMLAIDAVLNPVEYPQT